jgi:GDP-mannose 6-dehydrogenase
MRVAIFGLGYVGCVSAARLAEMGHSVVGVDVNPEKVAMVNAGLSPIVEPGLEELLARVCAAGGLRATSFEAEAVGATDLALICVGTPGQANGQLRVDILAEVCRGIGRCLRNVARDYTVVVRSTVLPGTMDAVVLPALTDGAGGELPASVTTAVNPEFMREGSALRDFMYPPLTLVGCEQAKTAALLGSLYAGVAAPFVHTKIRTAEMIKYSANAFHALKVCFANEIGDVCEALGADPQEVMRIFCMDHKLNISEAYLRPGFAFGGSCLPKDLRALTYAARSADAATPLLASILPSNEARIRRAVETILATRKKHIGVVGLAFKPGTDDLRESPMVTLVEALIGKGLKVRILDHNVSVARLTGANRRYIEEEIPHIASLMCQDRDALLRDTEVIVVGNADDEASHAIAATGPSQLIIDLTRGLIQPRYANTHEDQITWPQPLPDAWQPASPAASSHS